MSDNDHVYPNANISSDRLDINELVPKYIGIITYYAKKMAVTEFDIDDFISEGLLGLLSAVRTYDNMKSSFPNYAKVCILNRMRTAISSKKNVSLSSDIDLPSLISDSENPEKTIISKEKSSEIYNAMLNVLSSLELNVLNLFLSDESYESISKLLNISVKSVDNALQRARKKIKLIINSLKD